MDKDLGGEEKGAYAISDIFFKKWLIKLEE